MVDAFKADLLAAMPSLRAFAISLTGNPDRADDILQETLMKAWANRSSFHEGTSIRAWLFTILRNEFYTYHRKRSREVEDADGRIAANRGTLPEQQARLDLTDMQNALQRLPSEQREALLLVTASDLSYEDAAQVCGTAIGTIKSRVNRARNRLAEILETRDVSEYGAGGEMRAAVTTPVRPGGGTPPGEG
ncbi:MAG: sigma-70 family RNA polymerase sigma factor [Hyphomicrobiales bacterium]